MVRCCSRISHCLLLSLAMLLSPLTQAAEDQTTLVQTQSGPIRGQLSQNGAALFWLGVPYAQPPIGERRWQAPQAPLPWSKELQAKTYGSACSQIGWFYGPPPAGKKWGAANVEVFGKPVGSEDCLTLNIWRPSNLAGPMPVIVFVHGGSNVVGHAGDPLYNGEQLALTTKALVVTINYRLGVFGWFAHLSLEGKDPLTNSGNYAALDIMQALRFVQANAAALGGDPKNITLMGQSAGAGNTYSLIGSPLSRGLFQKAILLSGLIERKSTKQKGYEYADQFMAQMAIDDHLAATHDDAVKLVAEKSLAWKHDYLKLKTADQLLNAMKKHKELSRGPHGFNDGVVLSENLPEDVEQGRIHPLPMIVGMARDESKLLFPVGIKISGPQLFGMMRNSNPDAESKAKLSDIVSPYLLPNLSPALFNSVHWGISTYLEHDVNRDIKSLAKHNSKVYAYRFEWDHAPEPWDTIYGACHACDLPFLFGNFSDNFFSMEYPQKNKAGREALSATMMNAIGSFVHTGDPNNPKLRATWKPWSNESNQQRLIFNASDQDVVLSIH